MSVHSLTAWSTFLEINYASSLGTSISFFPLEEKLLLILLLLMQT